MDNNRCEFLNRVYDLVVWKSVADYGTRMSNRTIDTYNTKKVKNLKLMNISSLGTGQVHFEDENGAYVLYPWCAIITMEPSPIREVKAGDILKCIKDIKLCNFTFDGSEGSKFKVLELKSGVYTLRSINNGGNTTLSIDKDVLNEHFKFFS